MTDKQIVYIQHVSWTYSKTRAKRVGEVEITMLRRVVKEGLPETVTFEQRSGKVRDDSEARND